MLCAAQQENKNYSRVAWNFVGGCAIDYGEWIRELGDTGWGMVWQGNIFLYFSRVSLLVPLVAVFLHVKGKFCLISSLIFPFDHMDKHLCSFLLFFKIFIIILHYNK